jgi:outer membrane protein assembly factor BamB
MQDMRHYLSCLDAKTGKVLWQQSLEGTGEFYASPLGADGKVYCMSDSGHVLVLAAGDQFQVLSRIDMGETPCRSSISAANGHLFIRTGRNLYCVGK